MKIEKLTTSYTIDVCKHDTSRTGWTIIKTYKDTKQFPEDTVQDIGHLWTTYWDIKKQLFDGGGFKIFTNGGDKEFIFCGPDQMKPGHTGHYTSDLMFTIKRSCYSDEDTYFLDGIDEGCELENTLLFQEILKNLQSRH